MYAPSTIGMTVYSLIAVAGGPVRAEVLRERCKIVALPDMPKDEFALAMKGLVDRGRVVVGKSGYDIADKQRRIVGDRDRSDGHDTDEDGVLIGGWNGWLLRDAHGKLTALEAKP